jgi:hypothetical protein
MGERYQNLTFTARPAPLLAHAARRLADFVTRHRPCGQLTGDAPEPAGDGYTVTVSCSCGAEFRRWVTPEDAGRDRVLSDLLTTTNRSGRSESLRRAVNRNARMWCVGDRRPRALRWVSVHLPPDLDAPTMRVQRHAWQVQFELDLPMTELVLQAMHVWLSTLIRTNSAMYPAAVSSCPLIFRNSIQHSDPRCTPGPEGRHEAFLLYRVRSGGQEADARHLRRLLRLGRERHRNSTG